MFKLNPMTTQRRSAAQLCSLKRKLTPLDHSLHLWMTKEIKARHVCLNSSNVAEALVSQGLARAIRHRQDDEQRSSKYDELLTAESRAQKKGAGIHSAKEPTTMKIADVSGVS